MHILLIHSWNILQDFHVWGHHISLDNFKKTEVILDIISNHNGIKLEIKETLKIQKYMDIKQYTVSEPKTISQRKSENFLKQMKAKTIVYCTPKKWLRYYFFLLFSSIINIKWKSYIITKKFKKFKYVYSFV